MYGRGRRYGYTARQFGSEAEVLVPTVDNENSFGNPQSSFDVDRTVYCMLTYPNRNTQVESYAGEHERNEPLFIFPIGQNEPEPPEPGNRLRYRGDIYEMKAPTRYDGHVEMFGQEV